MTALNKFNPKLYPNLERDCVATVEASVVYYVFTGRNAWHSTWIQRYAAGCMHTNIESAKRYAEARRTQGTVFIIKQLPAVHVRTDDAISIIATQINTPVPLWQYVREATGSQPRSRKKLIENSSDAYLVKGASALGAALSFECDSRFWRAAPPLRDSVVLLASKEPDFEIEQLGSNKLQAWSSYSNGGNYLLGWRTRENDLDCTSVRALSFSSGD